MRAFARLSAFLFLAGCPPKPAAETGPSRPVGHADLKCPAGTAPAGYAPPHGWEVWCEKFLPDGTTVREGPSIAWHPNEQRKAEGSWADGRQHGPWVYWYPTGAPQSQGTFAMGAKEGVWTTFQPDGQRASEGQFVDGAEHGPWTFWNAETLTRTEGSYLLGDRDGIWIDYGPDDEPVRERTYRSGRMTTMREL